MVEKTEVVKDPNGMWRLRLQVIDLTGEDSHLLEFPQGEERNLQILLQGKSGWICIIRSYSEKGYI